MELDIKNFAKIKEADIVIDGITVIAGENNTGKSTVGKILFSLFNSLNDIEAKITKDRMQTLERRNIISCLSQIDIEKSNLDVWTNINYFAGNINKKLEEKLLNKDKISYEILRGILVKEIKTLEDVLKFSREDGMKLERIVCANVMEVLQLSEDTIIREIITDYFNRVFAEQINMLSEKEYERSALVLKIKDKKQELSFENNLCIDYEQQMKLQHKAIYIDNPLILDHLRSEDADLNPMEELLLSLLNEDKPDVFDGIVEKMLVKEKLQDIYKMLRTVVDGEIILNQNDTFCLKSANFKEPIILKNLSTGLKSFVILKMLLEKGALKEKDVVILDEPEIHLHPQWQIVYAELIVLLQKVFDLSIVVTTHSPYFVDALNLFSCKYETDKRVNYYLSSNMDNMVRMDCVSDHIESIYQKMVSPIEALDTLRYELNNK